MLRFIDPADTFLDGAAVFPDHLDPRLRYYLPPALALSMTPEGDPDFFLLRYHGDFSEVTGGLLRFRLRLSSPPEAALQAAEEADLALRAVPFDEARFRLRLRSWQAGQEDQDGEWHPAVFAGPELVAPMISLDARETAFLKDLLEGGQSAVELELQLRYQGIRPGLPWLAIGQTELLRGQLAAALPPGEVREDQVVAAFLSFSQGEEAPVSWRPLVAGTAEPPRDRILSEIARRALDRQALVPLFERLPAADPFEPALYRLLPAASGEPAEILWDLRPPRPEARTVVLAWSASELDEYLKDPVRRRELFPIANQVSPFSQVVVHVINRVPYDPAYLKRVAVDLRYRNDAGLLEFRNYEFNGEVDIERFSTFYQTLADDLQLEYRLTSTLAPPGGKGWPAIRRGDWHPANGTVVEVNRRSIQIDFVRVEAEPEIFEKASAVEVEILASPPEIQAGTSGPESLLPLARHTLTGEQPAHWVALPDVDPAEELHTRVIARPPLGQDLPPRVLREEPIQGRRVFIAPYQLEVLNPDPITIQLAPESAPCCLLVTVFLAPLDGESSSFTLEAEQPVVWNFFRSSIFAPLRYRYRLEWVAANPTGGALPVQNTDWITAESAHLVVRPPVQAPEMQT